MMNKNTSPQTASLRLAREMIPSLFHRQAFPEPALTAALFKTLKTGLDERIVIYFKSNGERTKLTNKSAYGAYQ